MQGRARGPEGRRLCLRSDARHAHVASSRRRRHSSSASNRGGGGGQKCAPLSRLHWQRGLASEPTALARGLFAIVRASALVCECSALAHASEREQRARSPAHLLAQRQIIMLTKSLACPSSGSRPSSAPHLADGPGQWRASCQHELLSLPRLIIICAHCFSLCRSCPVVASQLSERVSLSRSFSLALPPASSSPLAHAQKRRSSISRREQIRPARQALSSRRRPARSSALICTLTAGRVASQLPSSPTDGRRGLETASWQADRASPRPLSNWTAGGYFQRRAPNAIRPNCRPDWTWASRGAILTGSTRAFARPLARSQHPTGGGSCPSAVRFIVPTKPDSNLRRASLGGGEAGPNFAGSPLAPALLVALRWQAGRAPRHLARSTQAHPPSSRRRQELGSGERPKLGQLRPSLFASAASAAASAAASSERHSQRTGFKNPSFISVGGAVFLPTRSSLSHALLPQLAKPALHSELLRPECARPLFVLSWPPPPPPPSSGQSNSESVWPQTPASEQAGGRQEGRSLDCLRRPLHAGAAWRRARQPLSLGPAEHAEQWRRRRRRRKLNRRPSTQLVREAN